MEDEELLNDFLKKKYSPKKDSRFTEPGKVSAVAGYNTGIGESQYDENFLPNLHNGEGDFNAPLNKYRAKRQTGWDQLGNAAIRLTNIIPEAVGSIASALDFEDYANSNDEVGNWLTSLTESWKQETNEEFPIYRETPGKTFDVSDSGWWIENGSSLVNSVGGFAIGGGIISK